MRNLQRNKRQEVTVAVAVDGTATATVDVAPGPSWEIKQIAVSVTGSSTIPTCDTYIGRNSSGVFISHTEIGDNDSDSTPNVTIRSGESVCAIWQSATPGATAKLTLTYDEVAY